MDRRTATRVGTLTLTATAHAVVLVIVTRLAAVRVPDSLALCSSYLDDRVLASEAIEATLKLAEALRRSHPAEARAALEKVLISTKDEAVRQRAGGLLQKMKPNGD